MKNNSQFSNFFEARRNGFGMNLYRNSRNKIVAGVCAGVAENLEIDRSVMRIIFVAALIFTGPIAFWAYVICWIVLLPKEKNSAGISYEYDENERRYRKKRVFSYPENSGERLRRARIRMDESQRRVEAMERYVTSSRFKLDKEFADLNQKL